MITNIIFGAQEAQIFAVFDGFFKNLEKEKRWFKNGVREFWSRNRQGGLNPSDRTRNLGRGSDLGAKSGGRRIYAREGSQSGFLEK